MIDAPTVVAWVAAFVALWWLIDWLSMRQEGERLPVRRAPLRVLGDALRKLWRNKTFTLSLICLWLIGASVAGVQGYLLTLDGDAPGMRPPQEAAAPDLSIADVVPRLLTEEALDALPRLVEVPLHSWGAILFALLLIAAMVRVMIDPPDAIRKEAAQALRWPTVLLCLHVAGAATLMALDSDIFAQMRGPDPPWFTPWLIAGQGVIMAGIFLAPAHALLWRLILEIARDGVWSFTSSLRSIGAAWLPAALLLLLTMPVVVWAAGKPPLHRALDVLVIALPVLLVFAPWTVVDRQAGLLAALSRSWRLFRARPVDVIAFGLRFSLLFAVLGGLVALAEPNRATEWATWYSPLLGVVRNALLLLQAMVLAILYVRLSELLAEEDACGNCPSAAATDGPVEDMSAQTQEADRADPA